MRTQAFTGLGCIALLGVGLFFFRITLDDIRESRMVHGMNSARSISAALAHKTRRNFRNAAATVPADVADAIRARAVEGVMSGEPHKATGGWAASPFYGKGHDIRGLLEIASKAVRSAQISHFNEQVA
jgi:hypothetical protein